MDGDTARAGSTSKFAPFHGQSPGSCVVPPVTGHHADQADFIAESSVEIDDLVDMGPQAMPPVNGHIGPFPPYGMAGGQPK